MRRILDIGHNDLRLFLKSKSAYIWLFAVPLAFIYFMGFANRGPGAPGNPRPMVMVDNRDTGFLGQSFLDELGQQGLQVIAPDSGSGAERGIRLGTNFTAEVLAGRQSRVEFLHVQGSSEAAAALVQFRIVRALVALNSHLLEQAAVSGGKPPTAEALTALRAAPDPVVLDARFAGRKPIPTGFNLSLPGVMVMYLLMNLLTFGGSSLAGARRFADGAGRHGRGSTRSRPLHADARCRGSVVRRRG